MGKALPLPLNLCTLPISLEASGSQKDVRREYSLKIIECYATCSAEASLSLLGRLVGVKGFKRSLSSSQGRQVDVAGKEGQVRTAETRND